MSVIAVHGLADSAAEVDAFASHLVQAFPTAGVRWIFPKALPRPVTLYGGRSALAWFDVYACNRSRVDENGIEEASACLARVIARERRRGVPAERIVLGDIARWLERRVLGPLRSRARVRVGSRFGCSGSREDGPGSASS